MDATRHGEASSAKPLRRGQIELICGCMFSGKSERLLARLRGAKDAGLTTAAFKHACDDRYGRDAIVSHNGERAAAVPVAAASEILAASGEADLVVVDEAQFFDDALSDVCLRLVESGADVVLSGLDRDCWGQPFGPMPAVAAIADQIISTKATCARCGRQATFTQRVSPVDGTSMVGGAESYEPRCQQCFQPPPVELRR